MSDVPTTPTRYFIGYRDEPPAVVWPSEARVAVNFCINYEEGGELCVLINLIRAPAKPAPT